MNADKKKFYLAARRKEIDGVMNLVIVDPWTGERYENNEVELRIKYNIHLGDFLHAKVDGNNQLCEFGRTEHSANILVKVEGNVAFVTNLMSKLNLVYGTLVFQNKLFGDSICHDSNLPQGDYKIRLNLLETPITIKAGRVVHFEASSPEPKIQKVITGAGFAAPPAEIKVFGEGFAQAGKREEPVKNRAVVLSKVDKPIGTHYYLWNLDSKTEGLFVSNAHSLEPGHFFTGIFKKKPDGKCTCLKYEKPLEPAPFTGGIRPNGKIYFTVKIDKYEPAKGNMKYAHAMAKYIGEVLEGETEATKLNKECNGKMVNIQRRGIGQKDFVWAITEILDN
ncbi:hypothetical protein B9Z55_013501 [Caenorhabditis nigoni]|uniref:Uncharacterized protein n=2 Tax=Caenorhabditis nigoni TaxID=1611254 RepID=A0A2G5U2G9_9PELO|nr:hypothetical protein B9Z55_013501 [Caenorhabditis nigoni]